MLRVLAITILGGSLLAWVLLVPHFADQPLEEVSLDGGARSPTGVADEAIPLHDFKFTTNEDCEPCHREIFEEWFEDQHSQAWFNEPLLEQNPKLTECNNCHAPQPILVVGIEKLPTWLLVAAFVVTVLRHFVGWSPAERATSRSLRPRRASLPVLAIAFLVVTAASLVPLGSLVARRSSLGPAGRSRTFGR